MTDDELDAMVAAAAPLSAQQIDRVIAPRPEASLLEAIMQTTRADATPAEDVNIEEPSPDFALPGWDIEAGGSVRQRRRWLMVPMAAAAAAVLAFVALPRAEPPPAQVWAAPMVTLAEGSPRYVVVREGWRVVRADELSADAGEMTFADGEEQLELRWQPASSAAGLVEDRARSAEFRRAVVVDGLAGELFRYSDSSEYTAVWQDIDHVLEARGSAPSVESYIDLLADLRRVSVDEWLSALPASAVQPADRSEMVDEMLEGIPLPEGFDDGDLRQAETVSDEYQLGAAVAGAVACQWIERWVAAVDAGDAAAIDAAVAAMETSPSWPVLAKMNARGDYPEAVWELAAAMRANGDVPAGRPMTVRESYRSTLGCD